jgi:hypothetical protein
MALTGHTITVELLGDVPELKDAPIPGPAYVIVERRDGRFIRDHDADIRSRRNCILIWDKARYLAVRLAAVSGEHENLWFVGSWPRRCDVRCSGEHEPR